MSWATNQFLSEGVERILLELSPYENADGCLISPATRDFRKWDTRLGDAEDLHSWFRRVTGGSCPETVKRRLLSCMFEGNAAFFGNYIWKAGLLYACSFQILLVDGKDLFSFRNSDAGCRSIYYRLDIEEYFRGNLFDHSVPHIHCGGNNAPRFPFPIQSGESALVAFLEFVYHHHFYCKWLDWVMVECAGDSIANVKRSESLFQAGSMNPGLVSHTQGLDGIRAKLAAARRRRSHQLAIVPESWRALNYYP